MQQQCNRQAALANIYMAPRPMPLIHLAPVRLFSAEDAEAKSEGVSSESGLALKRVYGFNFDEETKERARDAFDEMMATRTQSATEINEMVNVYFKRIDNKETVNWDDFDGILQQCL